MAHKPEWADCGLCGEHRLTTREHVVPKSLYAPTRSNSRFQRIIIAACKDCNNGSADDDAHFRFVLTLAGDTNSTVDELWSGKVRRALAEKDGRRRALDVFALMRPAPDVGPDRHRIYPADDPRVLRSVRKIIRGLSRHHRLNYPIRDDQVLADVQRLPIADDLFAAMEHRSAEPDVLEYAYLHLDDPEGLLSQWWLRFFKRTSFTGLAYASEAKRQEVVRSMAG
ncbi:MAG: hypothetical protein E5V66_10410 [Mesorhizobium sp.]|uniref:hypothetical protein n=1 Tax=Mesorhizobium sp. TaxID=1871066 RepID=UPI0011FD7696|nr:hypothetical protein [Mesorhizobium sp.]TIV81698.1 MAG: hypothetical protein E5V64_14920 [Mesorhizobium sp.]TIW12115.1 MAG: hypothetical protein E5V66_10410 [Mesorhizobium sp.]